MTGSRSSRCVSIRVWNVLFTGPADHERNNHGILKLIHEAEKPSENLRLHITGNAGAGKTTLARSLGEKYGLPTFHLDRIAWQPGWKKTGPEERAEKEAQLVAEPSWVIEGVSDRVRRAADVTVFLDVPRAVCLLRCVKRNVPYLFRSRPELPDRCPEILILPKLIRIIWLFPYRVRPNILLDSEFGHRIMRIRNTEALDELDLLNELGLTKYGQA